MLPYVKRCRTGSWIDQQKQNEDGCDTWWARAAEEIALHYRRQAGNSPETEHEQVQCNDRTKSDIVLIDVLQIIAEARQKSWCVNLGKEAKTYMASSHLFSYSEFECLLHSPALFSPTTYRNYHSNAHAEPTFECPLSMHQRIGMDTCVWRGQCVLLC